MRLWLCGLAVCCLTSAADARDHYVSPMGVQGALGDADHPLPSIREALGRAQPGDTIRLLPGVHAGHIRTKRDGVTIVGPADAIVRGPAKDRAIEIVHDRTTLRGFTIEQADIGVWLEHVRDCTLENLTLSDLGGEAVRIKNQSENNVVRQCRFERLGRTGFNAAKGKKNGEGVYIGTAPEQRSKNDPPNVPDRCRGNIVEDCTFRTEAAEAVDIKEDSEENVVRRCTGTDSRDPDGAVFGARGDRNRFEDCVARDGLGHGFRFGGDTVPQSKYGQETARTYGKDNVVVGCTAEGNRGWGLAAMVHPQALDDNNRFRNNGRGSVRPAD